jgi:hypothetical protein
MLLHCKRKRIKNMSGMELREKQILQLKRNLDKIYRLKNEILKLAGESQNAGALKNKMAEVLLLLGSIASCANPRNEELESFMKKANLRFVGMEIESSPWPAIEHEVELFCEYINSIAFNFTTKGVKVFITNAEEASR